MKKIIAALLFIFIPSMVLAVKTPPRPPRVAPDSIPAVFEKTTVVAGIHGYHYTRQGVLYLNEDKIVATYNATAYKDGRHKLEEKVIFETPYRDVVQVMLNEEARTALLNGKLPTVPAGMWEYYGSAYGIATTQLVSQPVIGQMRGRNQDAVAIIFKKGGQEVSVVMHTLKNYGPAIKKLIEEKMKK